MHPVYIRLIVYVLSTVAGMIPAAWAGWISYDAAAGMLQISVQGLGGAIAAGLALALGVFKKWGVK